MDMKSKVKILQTYIHWLIIVEVMLLSRTFSCSWKISTLEFVELLITFCCSLLNFIEVMLVFLYGVSFKISIMETVYELSFYYLWLLMLSVFSHLLIYKLKSPNFQWNYDARWNVSLLYQKYARTSMFLPVTFIVKKVNFYIVCGVWVLHCFHTW